MPDQTVLSNQTVLVADDNEAIRDTTAMILRAEGYSVIEAADGEEALHEISTEACDVVVLDVRMPKRDGFWVVENIDPMPPPPVVVMASAYNFDEETIHRLGARVSAYLRKPVAPARLLEAVGLAAETTRSQGGTRLPDEPAPEL